MSKYTKDAEMWKDIYGCNDNYQISNLGRVKSKERTEYMARNACFRTRKEKIMKLDVCEKGYARITLWENSKMKNFFVHCLVAIAFLPNPENYPIINHKDENPSNNKVDNLEWCNHSYNAMYGGARDRNLKNVRKRVVSVNLETGEKRVYRSAKDAEIESNGYFIHQGISRVCTNERTKYKNHHWYFEEG